MKKLIILRHAKSSWENMGLSDFERPLNKTGVISAKNMGAFINAKEGSIDLILSSSAKRAYETAAIIAEAINYDIKNIDTEKKLYLAWVNEILKSIRKIHDSVNKCIIVGHNPGFTELINYFGVMLDNLPTSSAACFEFDTESWQNISANNADLVWFQLARDLR